MARSPAKKLSGWWLEKVRANAKPHLEDDESVQAAAYGPQTKRQLSSFVCFWKVRLVAATERNIYVFRGGAVNSARVAGVLEKHSLEHASVARQGRAVRVGDTVIWPPPGAGTETAQLLEYVSARARQAKPQSPAPEPATPSVPPPA